MTVENRQKIPVPRRSFLWSLNETSGEILTHVGPTEFTPSANDRIVRANASGGYEQAPMEARPFVVARDGEYLLLLNPVRAESDAESPNGSWVPGGNKEKELMLGTTKVVPGPCAFPLWPGQSAEVRPAHKLGANHYLLVEVVGEVDEKARYYKLVLESAGLSSAVIDAGEGVAEPRVRGDAQPLRLGQRIVVQGRHTQLFIPPSGIEVVPPVEEDPTQAREDDADGIANLPPKAAEETGKLLAQVREGLSYKQFSVLKNELRHRQDLNVGERAVMLSALDAANEERQTQRRGSQRAERRSGPQDPYARRAVVLGPKEFCVLFDADGNPRIVRGPARVFPGPHDTFLHRGSRRRIYDAYELAERQALWVRIISPIHRDKLRAYLPGVALANESYDAGAEFILWGQPTVFFPFIEAEVIHPETGEPHVGNDHSTVVLEAIGIDQKSGVYVRDRRTGMVKMIVGETSYLVDPRFEEHVHRRVPLEQWNLWIARAEPHKAAPITGPDAVTTPWAISVTVPNNEACLITSRHGRRVEVGPKVVLLDYEELLTPLRLSKGPSKDGHETVTTSFLRVTGGRVADTFEVESSDFVRFKLKLGLAGHFDAENAADRERWFHVEDPVKLLADTVRARVREAIHVHSATSLLKDIGAIVRASILAGEDQKLRFTENGMVVDHVDVLSIQIVDASLADLFTRTQRQALDLQLKDQASLLRLESERTQDRIDEEEHLVVRAAVERKATSNVIDADAAHRVQVRRIELAATAASLELARKQERDAAAFEASAMLKAKGADVDARADTARNQVDEAHRAALAAIDKEVARALAESDAIRLQAIQRELVGALHTAADAEVMKAAANNMNLVSLLGGKSPQELLAQILRGTPLERTTNGMRARSDEPPAE